MNTEIRMSADILNYLPVKPLLVKLRKAAGLLRMLLTARAPVIVS